MEPRSDGSRQQERQVGSLRHERSKEMLKPLPGPCAVRSSAKRQKVCFGDNSLLIEKENNSCDPSLDSLSTCVFELLVRETDSGIGRSFIHHGLR